MEQKRESIEMKDLMKESLVPQVLKQGGAINPLIIASKTTGGLGLCNPSIWQYPGSPDYLVNVRHVSYYLHHCEGEGKYQTPWGPLNYVRPDSDPYLRTTNYICDFNLKTMKLATPRKIDTSKFPKEPEWDFVGLEDGRLVEWEGKMYITGVRRYAPDGKGRMVLSEIKITQKGVKEMGRYVIEPPEGSEVYCEKNWMPILDMPFHYVKWANPVEVIKVDINPKWKSKPKKYRCPSTVVHKGVEATQLPLQLQPRGSSQVIPFYPKSVAEKKDQKHYICVVHECDYWHNEKNDRDSQYYHRFMVWDDKWNLAGVSDPFKFMDGRIEFCCGMAKHPDVNDFFVTFGFQDNSAYMVTVPENFLESIINWKAPESLAFPKKEKKKK